MTVYLAGPMTGLPELNYPAFNALADKLRKAGIEVSNPAENRWDPRNGIPTWADWMKLAIAQLLTCDEVLLLPGWESSRGAQLERHIAEALGLMINEVDS